MSYHAAGRRPPTASRTRPRCADRRGAAPLCRHGGARRRRATRIARAEQHREGVEERDDDPPWRPRRSSAVTAAVLAGSVTVHPRVVGMSPTNGTTGGAAATGEESSRSRGKPQTRRRVPHARLLRRRRAWILVPRCRRAGPGCGSAETSPWCWPVRAICCHGRAVLARRSAGPRSVAGREARFREVWDRPFGLAEMDVKLRTVAAVPG